MLQLLLICMAHSLPMSSLGYICTSERGACEAGEPASLVVWAAFPASSNGLGHATGTRGIASLVTLWHHLVLFSLLHIARVICSLGYSARPKYSVAVKNVDGEVGLSAFVGSILPPSPNLEIWSISLHFQPCHRIVGIKMNVTPSAFGVKSGFWG